MIDPRKTTDTPDMDTWWGWTIYLDIVATLETCGVTLGPELDQDLRDLTRIVMDHGAAYAETEHGDMTLPLLRSLCRIAEAAARKTPATSQTSIDLRERIPVRADSRLAEQMLRRLIRHAEQIHGAVVAQPERRHGRDDVYCLTATVVDHATADAVREILASPTLPHWEPEA